MVSGSGTLVEVDVLKGTVSAQDFDTVTEWARRCRMASSSLSRGAVSQLGDAYVPSAYTLPCTDSIFVTFFTL